MMQQSQQPQQPQQDPAHDPRAADGIRPHDVEQGAGRRDGSGIVPSAATRSGPGGVPGAAAGPTTDGQDSPDPGPAAYTPGAPIPPNRERITLRAFSTLSSAFLPLVGGGFGLVSLYGVVVNLVSDKGTIGNAVILAIVAALALPGAAFMLSIRTVLDPTGIHVRAIGRERGYPWPASRTGLYVRIALGSGSGANRAFACVVLPDGSDLELMGLSWTGPWVPAIEAKGVAECNRIWQWAVARGYTRETHEYVPLSGALGVHQAVRESQERRFGLR